MGDNMGDSPHCIGLLHSLTGTMAISEQSLLDIEKLAIDEINRDGGVLGCMIDPVIADGVSDPVEFQRQAELLVNQGITQLFGCWTSASRKAVKPVVEKNECLLWYPVQYEGLEESRHIIYSGTCLNQQITPAVEWLLAHLGKRIFLLGSDYVFPQAANKLVKSIITQSNDASIAGECYVPLGSHDFGQVIVELKTAQPEVIFNTLNGDSNLAFFKAYGAAGLAASTLPILSVSIGETEVQHIGPAAEGHYACWSYFQSLDNPENRAFMERFRQRFGSDCVCSDPMIMAYMQIYLWKMAVELAGSFAPSDILRVLPGIEVNSPAGLLTMNANHHLTKGCHIGRIEAGGQFAPAWSSPDRIVPLPWLGVERCDLMDIALIKESMAAFTDSLHYSAMLKKEMEERQRLTDEVVRLRERELRNSESFLEKIVENIPDMVFVKDAESLRFIRFNRAGEQLLGYDRDDLIGKSDYDLFPMEEADFFAAKDRMVLSSNQVFDIPEEPIKTRHQGERILHTKKLSVLDDTGKPQFLLGISEDITDRKHSVDALKESEEQHRAILKTALDGFWLVDPSTGKLLEVNDAASSMLGYTSEELLACGLKDIDVQWSHKEIDREIQKIKTAGKALFETQHLTKSGQIIDVEISVNYLPRTDQLFSFIRNVTERKRAEEVRLSLEKQLHQSQKMEAIGLLAGGVAHDFNNMLTVMGGYANLGLMAAEPSSAFSHYFEEILKASERSASLTHQLLAFARKQTISPRTMELNETVSNMLKMLQRLIGEDIQLTCKTEAKLWQIKMDPSQIDQILANLCINARDAINNTGCITIETHNSTVDEYYCHEHVDTSPGEYVRLSVSDDGCGMDRETQAHIFEPFYTTKEVGKGTGLGLATVFGIVRQNNGFVNVYSEPGQGTTFSIYLPRLKNVESVTETVTTVAPLQQGHETILLVEDEPTILQMTSIMLEMQGYNVLAAETPGEAIRLAQNHAGEIDLLLTDVIMPEMNGRDLSNRLLAAFPEMKRIFMSGYTADIISTHGVLEKGAHFIQKPFTLPKLTAKVREALDSDKDT